MSKQGKESLLRSTLVWDESIIRLLQMTTQSSERRKVTRRPWIYPAVVFSLDCLSWWLIYVGLSRLLGGHNTYGRPEILLPLIIALAALGLVGGYNPRGKMASLRYATEHIIACVFGFTISALAVYLVATFGGSVASSRGVFAASFVLFTLFSLYQRRTIWFAMARFRPKRSLLVIGDAGLEQRFYTTYVASELDLNLSLVATDSKLVGHAVAGPGTPVFEIGADDLPNRLMAQPENNYEAILVAADGNNLSQDVLALLAKVHFQDIPVYSLTSFYEAYWEKMPVHLLSATWPLQTGFHLVKHSVFASVKRISDIVFAAILLVLSSPVMLFAALAVRLSSPGPVIFRQTRVGQHRDLFTLFKFRTMVVGSEKKGMYTGENDPRITRIGQFLRKTRLDELPQLINVLRGDMSLIGPRAEWVKCVERYEKVIPHYHFRHLVRPGITGWAQVNYPYGASDEDTIEKLMYDLFYIRNFSLNLDASVVLKTLHVMLFGKGR